MFGIIIEKIVMALLGGINDHQLAFMFYFHYLSHFKTKLVISNLMNFYKISKCGLIKSITIGVL